MTIHHTTNYGIAYADTDTALVDFGAVTQEVANSLDAAMGRAGYTPPDASSFAAEVAARTAGDNALSTRVTALETIPAWTAIPGAPAQGTTYQAPQYRKIRDRVELRGLVSNSPGSNVVFATLPAGYRPVKQELIALLITGEWLDIYPDGRMSRSGTGLIPLTGLWFSVTA